MHKYLEGVAEMTPAVLKMKVRNHILKLKYGEWIKNQIRTKINIAQNFSEAYDEVIANLDFPIGNIMQMQFVYNISDATDKSETISDVLKELQK